ncbi:PAQR family membrane homeostasis protein TrhA [Nocardioides guangzhouensis]|uniref:PAQR family membrane homeostasis protein TrhA n=1 Tax=Nocardioides guangzhouensis TaxID=2497878 RepID=UPI001C37625F|nr:hemolysin III family protein [Nocardioides guangzhouensis]
MTDTGATTHHSPARTTGGDAGGWFGKKVSGSITATKLHLRGWLHLGILPLTLAGGVLLVALSPDARTRAGAAVFTVSALLLFGVSAAYHCKTWSPQAWFVLRRLDHCNIFLLVAGSCMAYAALLLDVSDSVVMLSIVWSTALLGVAARFVWPYAPRWLSPPLYVAAGWGVGVRARPVRRCVAARR